MKQSGTDWNGIDREVDPPPVVDIVEVGRNQRHWSEVLTEEEVRETFDRMVDNYGGPVPWAR